MWKSEPLNNYGVVAAWNNIENRRISSIVYELATSPTFSLLWELMVITNSYLEEIKFIIGLVLTVKLVSAFTQLGIWKPICGWAVSNPTYPDKEDQTKSGKSWTRNVVSGVKLMDDRYLYSIYYNFALLWNMYKFIEHREA